MNIPTKKVQEGFFLLQLFYFGTGFEGRVLNDSPVG